jgi:hypothetical protein
VLLLQIERGCQKLQRKVSNVKKLDDFVMGDDVASVIEEEEDDIKVAICRPYILDWLM